MLIFFARQSVFHGTKININKYENARERFRDFSPIYLDLYSECVGVSVCVYVYLSREGGEY